MSASASDAFGKFCAIFLPISAFAAIGLDHSVANMYELHFKVEVLSNTTVYCVVAQCFITKSFIEVMKSKKRSCTRRSTLINVIKWKRHGHNYLARF